MVAGRKLKEGYANEKALTRRVLLGEPKSAYWGLAPIQAGAKASFAVLEKELIKVPFECSLTPWASHGLSFLYGDAAGFCLFVIFFTGRRTLHEFSWLNY